MSATPVGGRGRTWEIPVERGKIREFAAVMQSVDPAYRAVDAVVPPTFLACGALWAEDGDRVATGFDRARLLHGEQEYAFCGPPPRAGTTLSAVETVTERYTKPGRTGGEMSFAVVVTDYRDPAGVLVAQARATYIERAAR